MTPLLSSAYWPNLHYFYYLVNYEQIAIEQWDHYQKQSYRNRTTILSANGLLDLNIPVKKLGHKELMKDVEISYSDRWQQKHWRAIASAYGSSPYFEFFGDEIAAHYEKKYYSLLEHNTSQLTLLFQLLKIKRDVGYSRAFETGTGPEDKRMVIHPKKKPDEDEAVVAVLSKKYYQTFSDKFSFQPNLSILDLLFNSGLGTLAHLADQTTSAL